MFHCEVGLYTAILMLYMVIYGYIWVYMLIYGYIWLYMVIYGYIWLYKVIYGYIYQLIWLYMAQYQGFDSSFEMCHEPKIEPATVYCITSTYLPNIMKHLIFCVGSRGSKIGHISMRMYERWSS